MAWLHYQIRQNNLNQPSPEEWDSFSQILLQSLPRRNVEKIELVSFTAKGTRTLRWLFPDTDPEYCTQEEALKIAKKMAFFMFNSQGSNIPPTLEETYPEENFPREIIKCPICKEIIEISDFDRDGRTDPKSIHIGHEIPLSRALNSHNEKNVFWIHRRCNYIKGEQTLKESLVNLIDIIKNHVI